MLKRLVERNEWVDSGARRSGALRASHEKYDFRFAPYASLGNWVIALALALLSFGALAAPGDLPAANPPQGDLSQQQAQRQAVQPLNNAPVWKEVRSEQEHFTTVRGVETGVLIQSGGQSWRQARNGPITVWGGILVAGVALAIGVFYLWRGPLKNHEPPTGRLIQRFTFIDRAAHWTLAITFVILAVSGLIMLFGKHVLLPLFGYNLFSVLAQTSKNLHNFVGPLFLIATLFAFFVYIRDNVWDSCDTVWIKKAGGLLSGESVPSRRFNFGEKTWFWIGVVFLGLTVSISGLILDFPNFQQGRGTMQVANVVHVIGALIFMTLSLGHIYMGTVGAEGAYEAMRYGYVDEAWAREHHAIWYKEVDQKARRIGQGAEHAPESAPGAVAHSS